MTELISVSAVIPAYNCAHTLERAVGSLIRQTYPVMEIIIVNNNSTDNTQLIIEKLHKENPLLIIPLNENLPGANNARNKGLKIAQGKWIQLLDADDELLENKIKIQVQLIAENPNADVIYSGSKMIYRDILSNKNRNFNKNISRDIITGLITSHAGNTIANLWKHDILKKANLFDSNEYSSQEYYLMLEIFSQDGNFVPDYNFNSLVYVVEESVSRSKTPLKSLEIAENIIKLVIKLKDILHHKNIYHYNKLITRQISKMYFSEYLEHKGTLSHELEIINKKYQIKAPLYQRLIIYSHFIYGKYCPKSGILKYPAFALNFVFRLNKLI